MKTSCNWPPKPYAPPSYTRGSEYNYVYCYNRKKWIAEHRAVWEEANGPIPDGYVIHHVNGDKRDNRIENLEMLTMNEHHRGHFVRRMNGDEPPRVDPRIIKCPPAVAGHSSYLTEDEDRHMNRGNLSTDWNRVKMLAGTIDFAKYRELTLEEQRARRAARV